MSSEQLTRTAGAAEEKIRKPASRLKRFVAVLAFVAIVVFAGPPAYQYIRSQMAPSEAKGAWTQAKSSAEREDYEKAIQTADEIIAKFPRYAQKQDIAQTKTEWQQTLGALELWLQIEQSARQSQYERAILSAGKLLRDYPNSSYAGQVKAKLPLWQNIVSVSKQVIVLLTEAWNAKEARNLDAALASVMSALELDPNNAAARVLRAQVEAEKEAEDQIRQIAAEKQRQFENLKANAIASVNKKDWESAISLYTKASALHPDDPDVTDKLALSRFNLHLSDANSAEAEGDLKAAIDSYTKALSQTSSPVVRKELESAMSALQTHLEAEQMRLLLAQHLKMASEAALEGARMVRQSRRCWQRRRHVQARTGLLRRGRSRKRSCKGRRVVRKSRKGRQQRSDAQSRRDVLQRRKHAQEQSQGGRLAGQGRRAGQHAGHVQPRRGILQRRRNRKRLPTGR